MSGFVATSGKYEVFAPGSDTYVMFNDNNDVNAVSSLTFTKGTGTLSSTILQSATVQGSGTADLTIKTDGGNYGIILDSEDDTVEIKLSGATSATFGTGGLNIVSGDTYSIAGTEVVSATGSALGSLFTLFISSIGSNKTVFSFLSSASTVSSSCNGNPD